MRNSAPTTKSAQDAYQKAERQAWATNLDMVLLSSDSQGTVKRTHSSYFNMSRSITERVSRVASAYAALAAGAERTSSLAYI